MDFSLLGRVELTVDGRPVTIGAARPLTVLAMLLLNANQVVSAGRLIDALWDQSPPRTAGSQVQITISALRRLLRSPGDAVIETRSPGYLMHVPDEALDLRHFEFLAAQGAAAASERRPGEAAGTLRDALGLWRGPAMDGLDSTVIRTAAARLNERRLAVQQDCLELELQLGGHREVIGELMMLTAEAPLHERFRAQLMLALYRAGRPGDALEVFRAGRSIMRDELGLEPGEELRRLEHAILVRDPRFAEACRVGQQAAPAVSGMPPPPRQLPRAPALLRGREDLARKISASLAGPAARAAGPGGPLVTVTGRAGAGKTALAVRAAHLASGSFPGGQLFVQLRGHARPAMGHVLSQLLRSFGIAAAAVPDDVDAKAAMYRSWLTGRRVLIVIDDAASLSRAELLLPGNPDCAVLVTARGAMTGLAASHSFEVGPLDERSAGWLLADALGASRIDAEPEAARAVARLCDGLPLALRGAAARLAARPHWPVRALARRLADEGFRLDLLGGDNDGIRTTLAVSCANLSQAGRRLLCGLSRLGAADFTPRSCGLLLNCGVDAAEDLLEDLVAARLMVLRIAADGTVRFRLHDLVRIYAAEWPAGQEDLGCGEHGGPPAVAGHREAASPAGIPVLPTGRIAMAGEA